MDETGHPDDPKIEFVAMAGFVAPAGVWKGWHCQFLEEDMKTLLPRTLTFAEDRKIWEMAKRGGFTLNIAGRQELEAALRKGVGAIWLDLTRELYAKLRQIES